MVIQPEQLLESLLDLERSRQRERDIRLESEALLEGLRGIAGARGRHELFESLVDALGNVLSFEHAFILQMEQDGLMTVVTTTLDVIEESLWKPGSVFKRALAGRPIASYDVSLVPEWKEQPPDILGRVTSALHIGLRGGEWQAILVVTHHESKHFGPQHVKKAVRFSPLAAQAFLTLELQRAVIQRDRFFQLSMDVMAIFKLSGEIKQYNDGWTSVLGYEKDEVKGQEVFSFIHPDDVELFKEVLSVLESSESKQLVETRFIEKRGATRWLSCSIAVYQNEQLLYFVARDITDRVTYERRLAHQAGHDMLTGLKNRAEFMHDLQGAFNDAKRQADYYFAVFFLDLNKFKAINDTLGHDVGDGLLQFFAKALQGVVRGDDTVARLGGDEFTLLVKNARDLDVIEKIVARIHNQCSQPVNILGHEVQASSSIGVAIGSGAYRDEQDILQAADQAMYKAKRDRSVQYVMIDSLESD